MECKVLQQLHNIISGFLYKTHHTDNHRALADLSPTGTSLLQAVLSVSALLDLWGHCPSSYPGHEAWWPCADGRAGTRKGTKSLFGIRRAVSVVGAPPYFVLLCPHPALADSVLLGPLGCLGYVFLTFLLFLLFPVTHLNHLGQFPGQQCTGNEERCERQYDSGEETIGVFGSPLHHVLRPCPNVNHPARERWGLVGPEKGGGGEGGCTRRGRSE